MAKKRLLMLLSVAFISGVNADSHTKNEWLDPTKPISSGYVAVGESIDGVLELTEIIYKNRQYSAVINNKIVVKGSVIGKYTIVAIEKRTVTVTDGATKFVLDLLNHTSIR